MKTMKIRDGGEVMRKHDKTEVLLTAEVDMTEWLQERNHTLAKENVRLKERVKQLEDALAALDQAMEHGEVMNMGVVNELKEDISELEAENKALKEALVRASLREVEVIA